MHDLVPIILLFYWITREGGFSFFRSSQWYVNECSQGTLFELVISAIPGAPTSVRLIGISEDAVTIEWTAPSSDGGRPITRFVIEKREARSQFWSPVASVSSRTMVYQIQNLQANSSYFIRVAAENDEGIGYYREFIEPIRPMRPKSKRSFTLPSDWPHPNIL